MARELFEAERLLDPGYVFAKLKDGEGPCAWQHVMTSQLSIGVPRPQTWMYMCHAHPSRVQEMLDAIPGEISAAGLAYDNFRRDFYITKSEPHENDIKEAQSILMNWDRRTPRDWCNILLGDEGGGITSVSLHAGGNDSDCCIEISDSEDPADAADVFIRHAAGIGDVVCEGAAGASPHFVNSGRDLADVPRVSSDSAGQGAVCDEGASAKNVVSPLPPRVARMELVLPTVEVSQSGAEIAIGDVFMRSQVFLSVSLGKNRRSAKKHIKEASALGGVTVDTLIFLQYVLWMFFPS